MRITTPDGTTIEAIPNCMCRPFPESMMRRKPNGEWYCPRSHWWNRRRHVQGSKGGGISIPPGVTVTFSVPLPTTPGDRQN